MGGRDYPSPLIPSSRPFIHFSPTEQVGVESRKHGGNSKNIRLAPSLSAGARKQLLFVSLYLPSINAIEPPRHHSTKSGSL
uniref:Uncharacterized protein n=1 Tax=Picea glauca TaxID=3330 RepID=A0A101M574_PICGL|nr:hypothetical protein ABT39_MTgene953 [Picea glauca]QHR86377.1 hypothetical protein Q903MT_gene376 [Picea sitchensis]